MEDKEFFTEMGKLELCDYCHTWKRTGESCPFCEWNVKDALVRVLIMRVLSQNGLRHI
jgi:hypothetical protein